MCNVKAVTHGATSFMRLVVEKIKPEDLHCHTMRLVTRDSVYIPGYNTHLCHACKHSTDRRGKRHCLCKISNSTIKVPITK